MSEAAEPARVAAAAAGDHVVLHVVVSDRPGVLGAVASRIGALGANITDIDIEGRRQPAGVAVAEASDIFHVTLPPSSPALDLVRLLVDEIGEVDGAHVERWWRPEPGCCEEPR